MSRNALLDFKRKIDQMASAQEMQELYESCCKARRTFPPKGDEAHARRKRLVRSRAR